jgi:hypothetical protein
MSEARRRMKTFLPSKAPSKRESKVLIAKINIRGVVESITSFHAFKCTKEEGRSLQRKHFSF